MLVLQCGYIIVMRSVSLDCYAYHLVEYHGLLYCLISLVVATNINDY